VDIVAADAGHWPQIWPIFAAVVEAGQTYAYPWPMAPEVAEQLWLEAPPGHAVVAVEDGRVLGTAKMGPNRLGRGSHVATASFMVSPAAQGRGVGRALAEHTVDWATTQGYRGMQFNAVVETNASAVHLWQALGFGIVGTVPDAFDHAVHGLVGLHVMYRPLRQG
jgi:L-amino acid N-acyltransferase YncA